MTVAITKVEVFGFNANNKVKSGNRKKTQRIPMPMTGSKNSTQATSRLREKI